MADVTKIGIEVESSASNTQNIKSLKAQLREAVQEAQKLSSQDFGSAEAVAAQKRVAQLRDQIDDTNDAIQSFTGAGQFQAFGKAVQGIAGGFTAAQGAMALFGSESEDLQKLLVQLNGAMALTQGLAALEDAPRAFMQIRTMIVSQVIPALGTLRGALIATGIGAAAVAVGLLVANWEKVVKVVREFIGLGPSQAEILKQNAKLLETQNKIFELSADKYDEFTQRKIKANLEFRKTQQELNESVKEGVRTQQEANALIAMAREKANREIAQSDADRAKATKEFEQQEFEKRQEKERKHIEELNQWKLEAEAKYQQKRREKADEDFRRELEVRETIGGEKDNVFKMIGLPTPEKAQAAMDLIRAKKDREAQREIETEQKIAAAKASIAQDSINIAAAINSALVQNDEVSKGIALAQIAYDSATALTKALSVTQSASADNVATGGLAGIAKFATIAGIIAVNTARAIQVVRSKTPMGISGGSGGGRSFNTPAPPSFTPAQGATVQGAGDINLSNQPQATRVFVVESDIRGTMNRVDVIERNRTIG